MSATPIPPGTEIPPPPPLVLPMADANKPPFVPPPPPPMMTPEMTSSQIQEMAERYQQNSYSATSYVFGFGILLFIIAIIFFILLPKCYLAIAYGILFLALILMLISAFLYTLSAPDRYCSKNPSNPMCAKRYA